MLARDVDLGGRLTGFVSELVMTGDKGTGIAILVLVAC